MHLRYRRLFRTRKGEQDAGRAQRGEAKRMRLDNRQVKPRARSRKRARLRAGRQRAS